MKDYKSDKINNDNKEARNDIVIGRNCVLEAIKSGRTIDSVLVANGGRNGSIVQITALCRKKDIIVKEVASSKLDEMAAGANHQGVIAVCAAKDFSDIEDIFALAEQRGEPPFIIIADELNDPHNLGAIIRTAEAAGAHGIIIPKRRSVGLTFTVARAAAGALEYMPIVRVANLASCIDNLKQRGVWVYAADMDGQMWCQTDLKGACALVVGSEGFGVGRLIKDKCDVILSLPMNGQINSLNASVAAGILMYEFARQRHDISAK